MSERRNQAESRIESVNELGGIRIKCRKLTMESGGDLGLESAKGTELTSEGETGIKTKKDAAVTGGKEIKAKGKKIKLSGTKGVTAEGKQIAVQDDKVMGFDVHIMVVPSGTGTTTAPLPHPFIGKLKDGLAKDVSIKDRKCAVKGSAARHDDATHMQLPGTIQFQNNPKKEGKVTGGTSSKVKIEGKEAAVIGSTVTTCNDTGMQDNSTVIAAGAGIPMPAIINPLNTEEWKREREEAEKKEPKFSSVKWAKTSAEEAEKREQQFSSVKWAKTIVDEGEEAVLTATVRDIADGNMVTLQVFPEGKGPEDGIPLAQFPLTVKGGSVSARWSYRADRSGIPPEENPRFMFSAHCAWCGFEKSGNVLEVRLVRSEITKAEWRDRDGNATSKGLVGEPLKLVAETKDMEGGVTFHVYDGDRREVFSKGAEVRDGRAEAEWNPIDTRRPNDTNELKYTFEVTGSRCKKVEGGECQIKNPKVVSMEWDKKAAMWGDEVELKISTFEMADELPECKVDIWEEEREHPNKLLQSATVKLDKDEIKVKFTVDFTLKEVSQFDKDDDYRIYAVLFVDCLGKYFKQTEENYLLVSNDF